MPQHSRTGPLWNNSHRVNKSGAGRRGSKTKRRGNSNKGGHNDIGDDVFPEGLTDLGTIQLLENDLTLRDVVQAMRYIRSHMFVAVPQTGFFTSTRTSEVLNYRAAVPPLVAPGHVQAVLADTAPARVERETAELVSKGKLRKVRVDRGHGRDGRAGVGEALIEAADLERLVGSSGGIGRQTADAFVRLLRTRPTAQTIDTAQTTADAPQTTADAAGDAGLTKAQSDELLRAGFLTSDVARRAARETLSMRPEDGTKLTSVQSLSRFASGTVSAVGGPDAIHVAGGSGVRLGPCLARLGAPTAGLLRIAVPGHGRVLKLADGAVDWMCDVLGCTRWGEAPEQWLRERFEGDGGMRGPRWRDFWGLEWSWLLGHAVGLGVVELFATGSVGRGVRALGG